MYSALHIMQWFSHSLDVFTPKIKRKFFHFYILWIKTNVAYTRLEMIARTMYCTTTTASNWFVTLYYKLLPAVRSSSKHGRWRSSLLLYSISMISLYAIWRLYAHFVVAGHIFILYTSHFKQLSLPFSVDYAYFYILYTIYYKQLLSSVVCKLWVSIFFFFFFFLWSGNCVWSFYYGDLKVFVNASLRKLN